LKKKDEVSGTQVDYLLLPADWAVHRSDGDKSKVGIYDPIAKTVANLDSSATENWDTVILV
jgi:hypothetical protein|tara:strand:- start:95 stop:277 length:183 start_codon:yes stop_codon:yes gene_type:complete